MSGRIRSIKPEWLEDERLVLASDAARVLSISLLLLADDYGNDRYIPAVMASRIFPGAPRTFQTAFAELVSAKFVILYRVDDQNYFSIRNWAKHQRVDKPGKPRVPQPTEESIGNFPGTVANIPGSLATDPIRSDPIRPDHDPIRKPRKAKIQEAAVEETSSPSPGAQIREAWLSEYRKKRGREFKGWGARCAGQANNLLRDFPLEEILMLIPYFFAWQNADVIKSGWQFGRGPHCFMMKIGELAEDVADETAGESRRASAGVAKVREKHNERDAYNEWSGQQALKLLEEEDRARQSQNRIEGPSNGKDLQSGTHTGGNRALGADSGATRIAATVGSILAGLPRMPEYADAGRDSRAAHPANENGCIPAAKDSRRTDEP